MQMQVVELSRTHDAWLSILCFNREVKRPSSAVIVTTDHELRVKICGETRKRCESTSLGLEKTSHRTLLYDNHIEEWWLMSYTWSSRFPRSTGKCNLFCPRIKAQDTSAMKRREKERRGRAGIEKEGRASKSQACSPNQQLRDSDPFCKAGGTWKLHGFPRLWNKQNRQRGFAALAFCSAFPLQSQHTACSMLKVPLFPQPGGKFVLVFHCGQL